MPLITEQSYSSASFKPTIGGPSVDSGQKAAHYSGQNCSGRVVAEWDLGGVSERLTRGLRRALLIRSTGWGDLLIGTGVLWRHTAACDWPVTRVSADLRLDDIRSSTRCLATDRQRSMFEFDAGSVSEIAGLDRSPAAKRQGRPDSVGIRTDPGTLGLQCRIMARSCQEFPTSHHRWSAAE